VLVVILVVVQVALLNSQLQTELSLQIRQPMLHTKHHLTVQLQADLQDNKKQHLLHKHHRLSVNQPSIYYLNSSNNMALAT
jgi:hypothetical protein